VGERQNAHPEIPIGKIMDNLVRTSACTDDAAHGILAQNATVGHLIAQVNLSREEIAEALEALAVKQRVVLKGLKRRGVLESCIERTAEI
jgi:hypothetical protein